MIVVSPNAKIEPDIGIHVGITLISTLSVAFTSYATFAPEGSVASTINGSEGISIVGEMVSLSAAEGNVVVVVVVVVVCEYTTNALKKLVAKYKRKYQEKYYYCYYKLMT